MVADTFPSIEGLKLTGALVLKSFWTTASTSISGIKAFGYPRDPVIGSDEACTSDRCFYYFYSASLLYNV